MERNRTKWNEIGPLNRLIRNGKFFVVPVRSNQDLKELFLHMASVGAGRPADNNGLPIGPWTPELLADAISKLDPSGQGIELRTVQHWFQDNDKSISRTNLHWLARVFGCADQEATSAWVRELTAAQRRLIAKRNAKGISTIGGTEDVAESRPLENVRPKDFDRHTKVAIGENAKQQKSLVSFARLSEAVLCGSTLNLPAFVFAGAIALGLSSYFLNINAVAYDDDILEVTKQVGFLWAPNWTILFMVFMPLFFLCTGDLLCFWKYQVRLSMDQRLKQVESSEAWNRRVEASAYTFGAVFLMCLAFAGAFQWVNIRLLPLVQGAGDYGTDWGSVAIEKPEIISVHSSILFTGIAYLYMSLCFYLLLAGIILQNLILDDFEEIQAASILQQKDDNPDPIGNFGITIMRGVFRCTVLVILIAMCMKLQSSYLKSSGSDILSWLFNDMASVFGSSTEARVNAEYKSPSHFTSLTIVLLVLFVFTKGAFRIRGKIAFGWSLGMMVATIALLVVAYLLIGAFAGFSILLGACLILAIYALAKPEF